MGYGVRFPVKNIFFSLPKRPKQLYVPPSLLVNEYRSLFAMEQGGRGVEANQSTPSSVEVNILAPELF